MTTKGSIYQDAIRLFGDARLDTIVDDVEARYALDDAWAGSVLFSLRAAAWRYALKTELLVPDGSITPIPGFATAYAKPADWVRTHALFILVDEAIERPIDIREQGISFYSNADDPVHIRFVSEDYADPELPGHPWPEHFSKAVAAHLAFQVADRLTNSANAAVRMSQLYGTLIDEAIAHDALPEDDWLHFQLNGDFQEAMRHVLIQGFWIHALKTAEFTAAPLTEPPPTTPIIGYPYSYPRPADFMRSHAFFVPAGDGREYPIDIKEDGDQWSTTAPYFAVRYISSDFGFDEERFTQPFLVAVLAYLRLAGDAAATHQTARPSGQPPPPADFHTILMASLETDAERENPWYRFQRNGAFLRACFHVAETGRWKFAINTIMLEADATLTTNQQIIGQLPANVYGDGSISPSYSAVFAKPADWLRTIEMYRIEWRGTPIIDSEAWPNRFPIDFRDEGGNWHVNWSKIQVRYIRRAAIESWRWPQSYADAVLTWCEYEEARTDPKMTQVAAAKQRIYEDMVDKAAKSDDMQEFPPYRTIGRLVRGRYSRAVGIGAQNFHRL